MTSGLFFSTPALYIMCVSSEIKVTFDPFRCRIRIYRNTYRALGSPKHIQFLVNPEELYFAILGLDHPMRGGTSNKVPDYYTRNTQQSIEVYSTLMINQILEIVGQLSYDNIYQLAGDVDSNNRIAYFSLRTITAVPRRRKNETERISTT